MLLPDAPGRIVVRTSAELRGCTYFPPGENSSGLSLVRSARAGDPGDDHANRAKIPNSDRTLTAGICARSLEKRNCCRRSCPAGPNNSLGVALRLAYGNGESTFIHGTSAPDSVGLRVSLGWYAHERRGIFRRYLHQVKTGRWLGIINPAGEICD